VLLRVLVGMSDSHGSDHLLRRPGDRLEGRGLGEVGLGLRVDLGLLGSLEVLELGESGGRELKELGYLHMVVCRI
jgi:hypothetical protein